MKMQCLHFTNSHHQKCCPNHLYATKFPMFILVLCNFVELASASGQLHFQFGLSYSSTTLIIPKANWIPSSSPQIRVEICAMEFRWQLLDPSSNGNGAKTALGEEIGNNEGNGTKVENCKFGRAELTLTMMGHSHSPSHSSISLPFSHSWRQSFAFSLRIWQGNDLRLHQLERIHRLVAGTGWLKRWANFTIKNAENDDTAHKLDIRVRVDCAQNFYGPGCDVRCELNDWERRLGRWECGLQDGRKQCAQEWMGPPDCSIQSKKAAAAKFASTNQINDPQQGNCECLNGGKCAQHGDGHSFRCECTPGYGGNRCEHCLIKNTSRCQGHCQRPGECECPEGMGGQFCEKDLIYCTRHQPCHNGGLCLNNAEGNYTCQCSAGFEGTNCERPITKCAQQPCQNGGKCVQVDDGTNFQCECPVNIFGRFCQIRAPRGCLSGTNPCQNGGTCAQAGHFQVGLIAYQIGQMDVPFKCHCPTGWTGPFCEQQFCQNGTNPCRNGAICLLDSTIVSGHRCLCPLGWEGPLCKVSVDDCRWAPCMNGASCRDEHNAFRCICAPGFRGELCQHQWLPIGNEKMHQKLKVEIDEKKNSSCSDCANGFWPTLANLLLLLLAIIALMALLALLLFLFPLIRQYSKNNGQNEKQSNRNCTENLQISVIGDQKQHKFHSKIADEHKWIEKVKKNGIDELAIHVDREQPRYVADPIGGYNFGPGQEAGAYLERTRRQRIGPYIILGRNSSMEREWPRRGENGGDETESESGYEQIRQHGRMPSTLPPKTQQLWRNSSQRFSQYDGNNDDEGIFVLDQRF